MSLALHFLFIQSLTPESLLLSGESTFPFPLHFANIPSQAMITLATFIAKVTGRSSRLSRNGMNKGTPGLFKT